MYITLLIVGDFVKNKKTYILFYLFLGAILFSYNNCSPSFESQNFDDVSILDFNPEGGSPSEIQPTNPIPGGTPTSQNKLSCNNTVNEFNIIQNNIGVLTKQQYENSIQNIFDIKVNSLFDPEYIQNEFRTSFQNRASNIVYTELVYDNAKLVLDAINNNNNLKSKIYYCDHIKESCHNEFITKYGRLLYRRPVTQAEIQKINILSKELTVETNRIDSTWNNRLKNSLFIMLTSPYFVYRTEGVDSALNKKTKLNQFDLASKLSFFLWGSSPDEALLDLAESNKLIANIDNQIDRMLASDKSIYIAKELGQNWLQMGAINIGPLDYEHNSFSNIEIKNALIVQVDTFIHDLIKSNSLITDLFSSNKMFHNSITKDLYQVNSSAVKNNNFVAVNNSLKQNNGIGLFAHMGFNSSISSGLDFSIFHRGPWIFDQVLCEKIPGPPSGVSLDGSGKEFASLTEALKEHSNTETSCASCHVFT